MTTPLLAPEEAQPSAHDLDIPLDEPRQPSEALPRPFRLGIVLFGAGLGLFTRLAMANGYGDLDSRFAMISVAVSSLVMGVGLALIAAERDRFGPSLWWITSVTALAWGALNWISPPFNESVTVFSKPDQSVLALVGVGNGMLLAGLISLAFVRRRPTLTVGATLVAAVAALTANSVLLHIEWPAIFSIGVAFALLLVAWDRSPRREALFATPADPPRVSRAALSFVAVALCGTAIQLWLSRDSIPRAIPALVVAIVLVGAAFVSLVRVRREIQRRKTTLSEWTSWMREIRTNDFRAEMENFESPEPVTFDPRPPADADGQAPRPLSFPNLSIPDDASPIDAPAADVPAPELDIELPRIEIPNAADDHAADVEAPSAALPVADQLPAADPAPSIVLPTADPVPAAATPDAVPAADPPPTADAPLTPDPAPMPEVAPAAPTPEPIPAAEPAPTPEPIPAAEPIPTPDVVPTPSTTEPVPASTGAFSNVLAAADEVPAATDRVSDLAALEVWLGDPTAQARVKPLLVAVEAMSLDEFESMPAEDQAMARDEIGNFLADTMPSADLVSWIDGPYFIIAHASKTDGELMEMNKLVRGKLRSTDGTLAFLRPSGVEPLGQIVDEAVIGLLQARQLEERATD